MKSIFVKTNRIMLGMTTHYKCKTEKEEIKDRMDQNVVKKRKEWSIKLICSEYYTSKFN